VRVWDCHSYSCLQIIHPSPVPLKDDPGPVIPLDQPAQLLKCVRSPGNLCVRFDAGGNWLLVGNAEGYLVLWSTRLNAAAEHVQCTKAGSNGPAAAAVVLPQVSSEQRACGVHLCLQLLVWIWFRFCCCTAHVDSEAARPHAHQQLSSAVVLIAVYLASRIQSNI